MSIPLLATKLYIPPGRPEMVSRPHLVERLKLGLDRKLALISAPAGFGKTTLLSEYAASCGRPVAWLSLDASDNDPTRFWMYVVAALQTVYQDLGVIAVGMLRSSGVSGTATPPSFESLLTGLINEIAQVPAPFALVLDDFHTISAQPIHQGLTFLLDNMPPPARGMQLILSSRADPPWPLARLRARGEMTELRVQDLRFSPEETTAFLNDMLALGLSPQDVAALEARTEGWIAGLQMVGIALQARLSQSGLPQMPFSPAGQREAESIHPVSTFIKALTGSHRYILDYLLEEVLEQQSSDVQAFLLQTSILDRMTAPLCDAVSGRDDSQTVLVQLDHSNLFLVPLDHERRWYRYHHLFADLLQRRLEQARPNQVPALHHKASQWYEQNGLLAEAVGHALAGGDVDSVARLVEKDALASIYQGEVMTLVGWLEALPEEVVRSRPWLSVAYAWALAIAGEIDGVEAKLGHAEDALERMRTEPSRDDGLDEAAARRISGHLLTLRAYTWAVRADVSRAAELLREAVERLADEDPTVRGFATSLLGSVLRWSGDFGAAANAWAKATAIYQAAHDSHGAVMVLCALAALQIEQGQLRTAAGTCRDALQITEAYLQRGGRRLSVAGPAYARMSALLHEWNDLEGALGHSRESLELCKRPGQAESLTTSYVALARALQAVGDADGAVHAMQQAAQVASKLSSWYATMVAAYQARLWLAQGDLAAASRWAAPLEDTLDLGCEPRLLDFEQYLTLARVLITLGMQKPRSRGEPEKALAKALTWLAWLLEAAEAAGATGRIIEILVLQAAARYAEGEVTEALTALERALSLAEREGYVRTFVEVGEPVDELLQRAARRGIHPEYVRKLLAAFEDEKEAKGRRAGPAEPRGYADALVEPLSERELQVLRLLITSLSTPEIADELVIATSTVRSHIKSIYGKLNVHSRMDAVQRAEELGLL
jgi:LuxR family maltose regulon positive regulatory protein